MYDCGFTKENNWFRYRAGAIVIENGCVLFAGNENENYTLRNRKVGSYPRGLFQRE